MAIKVLVNSVGQHIVADAKQIEEKESKKVIAYLVKDARVATYSRDEEGNINVGFAPYCIVSDEREFTLRAENIVAILEPRADVLEKYTEMFTAPEEAAEEVVADVEPVAEAAADVEVSEAAVV